MVLILGLFLFVATYQSGLCDSDYDGTELALAFMTHRHGDRTPTESSVSYSNDVEALEALSAPYGYGQLTDRGIQTAYTLGKFIRQRYDEYLAPKYNKSEVYIRSTDYTRARMTVLSALAAVFPPNDRAMIPNLNWAPTPYTTVPAKYDFNLATSNCPTITSMYASVFTTTSSRFDEYADVFETLADIGMNITSMPIMIFGVYDVYYSQLSLGLPLDPAAEAIFPRIRDAAGVAWDIIFGDEDALPYVSGVLLNEFFTYADTVISGKDTQKIRIYSAHDINVYAFVAITQGLPRPGAPKFGSLYSLELRKITETGKYAVLPVYLPAPGEEEIYLQIDGCDDVLCDYDQFKELTSSYAWDEDTWRTACDFDDDVDVTVE